MSVQILAADAGLIRYSWTGNLYTGSSFSPFRLTVGVASNASDLNVHDVATAKYPVHNAHIILAGLGIPYAGNGFIDLIDNSIINNDILTFSGDFFLTDATATQIASSITLPLNTFHFSEYVEPPPFFRSTATIGPYQILCCGQLPTTVVPVGTPVRVVIEPNSIVLGIICCVTILLTNCRTSNITRSPPPASQC
jgi:hypothetical protein